VLIGPAVVYRFGKFTFDVGVGELRRDGATVHLQPQPLELLLALLRRPGQIVTREELRSSLWTAGTHVEFDDALNHAMRRLRSVLGDTVQEPRCIETIPRRGYRFLLPVEEIAPARPSAAGPALRDWRRWKLAAGGLLLAAMTLASVFLVRGLRPPARIGSLAVLPFANLSGDPGQEYLADGMTDTLTAELSQIGSLRVTSRTSAMQYKLSKKPLPQIARELGVDGAIEGSVVRSGGRLRITVQLIDARSDAHIWARSYERDLRDVLAIQSDIALAIARGLHAELTPGERSRVAASRTVNPEAFDLYVQGRYWWSKRTPDGIAKALDFFRRSIVADPHYAAAYSGLADALRLSIPLGFLPPTDDVRNQWREAARTAVRLDESSSEAHTSLAAVYQRDTEWAQAEAEYRRALELDPNYAVAHHWYAGYLISFGRLDEALRHAVTAQQLDPLYLPCALTRANVLRQLGRLDDADAQLQRALRIDPDFLMGHCMLRGIREDQGRYPEAIDEAERCSTPATREQDRARAALLRAAFRQGGSRGYWSRQLKFGQEDLGNRGQGGEQAIVLAYAHLGDAEQALAGLARFECREMSLLLHEPVMKPFRSDSRYQQFLRCLHLQP
jgi:TolB-like protein/DNA-binding winged helix-turn-helix (wHTH) protein/Tfp pilus assembly protein PilF